MQTQTQSSRSWLSYLLTTLRSNWFYIALLIFLILFPHIVGWVTGEGPFGVGGRPRGQSIFWQSIFIEVFVLAILAMSYNLMFGFSGVISFGHALFFGTGGYILGIVLQTQILLSDALDAGPQHIEGALAFIVNPVLDIGYQTMLFLSQLGPSGGLIVGGLLGMLIAGILGFLIGLVSLRLKGVYFAIFTLAVAEMAFIYVGRWQLTIAEDGFAIADLPDLFNPTQNRLFYYYFALVAAVLTFLFIRRLMFSPTGRVLLAIRENEDRARALGYNTLQYKLLAITAGSVMAAGAGMLHVILNKKVGPEIMSVTFTIEPLLMTIIGGIGTFTGPVVGAAGLHLSERILNREFEIAGSTLNIGEHWSLILGIAFILVVLIFPQGIVGTFNTWRAKQHTRKRNQTRSAEPSAAGD